MSDRNTLPVLPPLPIIEPGARTDAARNAMLKRLMMYEFILTDMNLYLDTHPNSPEGLAHFRKYRDLHHQLMNEYVAAFGPIRPEQTFAEQRWSWIDGPWPWEREANI